MFKEKTKVTNADERRRDRAAWALQVVKAIRRPNAAPRRLFHTSLEGSDPKAPGVVYFAYSAGRIKIGYSTDVKSRMTNLATQSPLPVTLLLTIRGSEADEVAYHEMFAADRASLEWFRLSWNLRDFLTDRFEAGTHELMMNAEFDCHEDLVESAAYVAQVIEEIQEEDRQ